MSRSMKQVFEQFTQSHSRPRSVRNSESETKLRGDLPVPLCTSGVPTGQLYQDSVEAIRRTSGYEIFLGAGIAYLF